MAKPVFKKYEQHQAFLLPPSLEELIEVNHPVRTVNKVINSLDLRLPGRRYNWGTIEMNWPQGLSSQTQERSCPDSLGSTGL